jgi:GNAT superfamily N-acetyltransferase
MSDFVRKLRILHGYYKKEGFKKLYKFVYDNLFVHQKMIVFERDLSGVIEEVRTKVPINIRLLSRDESDINRLIEFWPDSYAPPPEGVSIKEMILNRLSVGEECMIAEYKGKTIHMNWIGFQNTHLFNNYITKKGINPGEALIYNIYTTPKYRGNKIMAAVELEAFKYLKREGYKRAIGYTASQNIAAMKVDYRVFKKKTNTLHYISILGFGRYFLSNRVK